MRGNFDARMEWLSKYHAGTGIERETHVFVTTWSMIQHTINLLKWNKGLWMLQPFQRYLRSLHPLLRKTWEKFPTTVSYRDWKMYVRSISRLFYSADWVMSKIHHHPHSRHLSKCHEYQSLLVLRHKQISVANNDTHKHNNRTQTISLRPTINPYLP